MSAKEPAFPIHLAEGETWNQLKYGSSCGLTKREYFAGLAMQGLLANSAEDELQRGVGRIAHISVEHADALLAELAK